MKFKIYLLILIFSIYKNIFVKSKRLKGNMNHVKVDNDNIDNIFSNIQSHINNENGDIFIFSECVNCPEIGYVAYKSFKEKYPDLILNLYLCSEDYDFLKNKLSSRNLNYYILPDEFKLLFFESGHLGTSKLWSYIILNDNIPNKVIHFDSDIYFRKNNLLNDIISKLERYDIVGPPRPYKKNMNGRNDLDHLPDLVQTFCFGFNKNKINLDNVNKKELYKHIQGKTFDNEPILDFFDPISRNIINSGEIYIINSDTVGGVCNLKGNRNNKYGMFNHWFDVGDEIIHFAAVGSGINFYKSKKKNKTINVPQSYVDYAINHYYLWRYFFEDNSINLQEAFKEVIFRGYPVNYDNIKEFQELIT